MIYLIAFILLLLMELLYFKIADNYNIIDKPNERSSHTEITLRGGGIIFFMSVLLYFVWSGFQYPWFFLGLTLMAIISFADDVITLSNKIRLLIHFISVILMAYELEMFNFPWYYLVIGFIFIVGVINAYNFMDGINGITACYSIAVCLLLMITNVEKKFIDQDLLIFSLIGLSVFAFFNFRERARCFAGDVGSVAIAFIILFALCKLILHTGNFVYLLFLTIYGLDAVWTIMNRIIKQENIFKAHRSHLYQFLVNEKGSNKLLVSFTYGLLQFSLGFLVIYISDFSVIVQLIFSVILVVFSSLIYLKYKSYVYNEFVLKRKAVH